MFDLDRDNIDLDQPNVLLGEAFAKDSLILLDALDFLRIQAKHGTRLYGSIDNHFNVNGHIATADFIGPHVEKAVAAALERKAVTPADGT